MLLTTFISRVSDGLILSSSSNTSSEVDSKLLNQAKYLLKAIGTEADRERSVVTADSHQFCVFLQRDVAFLCLTQVTSEQNVVFAYLKEVSDCFLEEYSQNKIDNASRAYEHIFFESTITRLQKKYSDMKGNENMNEIMSTFDDIGNILTTTLSSLYERGSILTDLATDTNDLVNRADAVKNKSIALRRKMLIKKYTPLAVIAAIVLLIIWMKFR
ncbi:hypothetical protein PCE1_003949 [Barthelona sp. PCE]